VDGWLKDGTREVNSTAHFAGAFIPNTCLPPQPDPQNNDYPTTFASWALAQPIPRPVGPGNPDCDPFGIVNDTVTQTVEALPPPVQDAWATVDGGVNDAIACTTDAANDPTLLNAPAPVAQQGANCLVGVVQGLGANVVGLVQKTAMDAIQKPLTSTVATLASVNASRVPFVGPLLDNLTQSPLVPDASSLGPMLSPASPWSPDGTAGTPLQSVLWTSTPYPRFLASTTNALMANPVFDAVSNAQTTTGAELIGTIDSGFYNVLIVDEDSGHTLVAQNAPIGTVRFIDFGDANDTSATGATVSVQATFVAKPDGTHSNTVESALIVAVGIICTVP